MSELDEAQFKASYGVNAEVPEPTGKTAQAPGKSKKQGDASAPAQGSSDIKAPGQSGTATEVSEDEDQDFAILVFSKNALTCFKEGLPGLKVLTMRLFFATIARSSWKTKLLLAAAPIRIVGRILHEKT